LNEVEEREAAVAVLLGDRDHQSQVALRQAPLGLLVVGVHFAEVADAAAEAGGVSCNVRRMLRYSTSRGLRSARLLRCFFIRSSCVCNSSTRWLNLASWSIIGSIRWVRRPSSSTRMTARQ